ncbi:TPA: hypothetical protein QDB04_000023 [Burkholderia vietnamiensis]|nr:hypothetical protein [Burkholderia vietnamiensis]
MKKYLVGVVLGLVVMGACAQTVSSADASSDVAAKAGTAAADVTGQPVGASGASVSDAAMDAAAMQPAAPASTNRTGLPPGVITEQNPLKLAIIEQRGAKKAYYRPNVNMPDLSNEDALRGTLSAGKSEAQARGELLGYMPKLRVLPCVDGCDGSAYDKAVAALVAGYRGTMPNIAYRGEMVVRVSRFHHLSFLASMVPTFNESISIQFVMQGRLVTLSKAAMDNHGSATDLAEQLGAALGTQVLMQLGLGITPGVTIPESKNALHAVSSSVLKVGGAILSAVGTDSAHSTVGPVTEGDVALLPAIDGIGPNEVDPLTETSGIE